VLREALSRLRAPGVRGASGAVLSVLEWACIDSGRWDDALAAAREANDIAAAYKMETVAGSADLATATVLAMRGDHDRVAPLLARVLAAVDVAEYRGFAARIHHAAGLAALAQGNYVTAYAQLSQLFAADGTPLHLPQARYRRPPPASRPHRPRGRTPGQLRRRLPDGDRPQALGNDTSGLGDPGPDFVGHGRQPGHQAGVLGPPGECHRAWWQVTNRHERHAWAFVPLADGFGGDAQARARRDKMGLRVQGGRLGDHRRRA